MGERLAIHGGRRAVREGLAKPWPAVGDRDREVALP